MPVSYSLFSAFAVITGDRSCERNHRCFSKHDAMIGPDPMIPRRPWYVIRSDTGCGGCHKRMVPSKGPAQGHVVSEFLESVIASEFVCGLQKRYPVNICPIRGQKQIGNELFRCK
jgi:hypothetical protein